MNIEEAILPFKIKELTSYISKKKKLSIVDSLMYLTKTELYKKLHNSETKYWYMSAPFLYQIIQKEKRQKMHKEKAQHELWLCFCVENFQLLKKIDIEEVMYLFTINKVFDFLIDGYDVLHTQGRAYIIEEIEQFIKNRNKK